MLNAIRSVGSYLGTLRRRRTVAPKIPDGFLPMGKFQANDIFIAGYPKSGNTWVQLLAACLAYDLDPQTTPDTLIQELAPDVHFKKCYRRSRTSMLFKTHAMPRPEYRRVINIVRDGRDVLCSFRHFASALGSEVSLNHLIEHGGVVEFGSWQDHITTWNRNPHHADVILVRYEDLIDDCVGQLARIADFIGVRADADRLAAIAAGTTAERMKDREARLGWDNQAWPKDKPFIRKGKKRSFEHEMTTDQIDRFTAQNRDTLSLLGYATHVNTESNV